MRPDTQLVSLKHWNDAANVDFKCPDDKNTLIPLGLAGYYCCECGKMLTEILKTREQ